MNHTKEPWEAIGKRAPQIIAEGKVIALMYSTTIATSSKDEEVLANTDRIIACVNACAGITNEALNAGIVLDSVKLHEAILDQQPSSFYKEYGVKVWEGV